jgi:hypothetical protein
VHAASLHDRFCSCLFETNTSEQMNQAALFHDSINDAIRADIDACGGMKKVAELLWKALDVTTGAAKLRAATNPDQSHKLSPEEVLLIKKTARENGSTAIVDFEMAELGGRVEWIDPEDELTTLMRDLRDDNRRIEARQKRIERLLERVEKS